MTNHLRTVFLTTARIKQNMLKITTNETTLLLTSWVLSVKKEKPIPYLYCQCTDLKKLQNRPLISFCYLQLYLCNSCPLTGQYQILFVKNSQSFYLFYCFLISHFFIFRIVIAPFHFILPVEDCSSNSRKLVSQIIFNQKRSYIFTIFFCSFLQPFLKISKKFW